MIDILTMGEVLIDLTQKGTDENGIDQFAAFPGGAPANVAVAASRLGARTGFTGKIGRDSFGERLRSTLEKDRVDTSYLYETDDVPTTLAIVHVDASGERSFAFYRQPGADTQITEEEACAFLGADRLPLILHFGSLSLTNEPARSASLTAVRKAREAGLLISYDPNYRPALWESEAEAIEWMKKPLTMADILKVSDEEMAMLTGSDDPETATRIFSDMGISLVMVTLGSEGVFFRLGDTFGKVPAVSVQVADTNGAGDTFLGAVLSKVAAKLNEDGENTVTEKDQTEDQKDQTEEQKGQTEEQKDPADQNAAADQAAAALGTLRNISEEELKEYLSFANRAAAITCSRPGAIPAMPDISEL